MAAPQPRVEELNRRAVTRLIAAHAERTDDPLVLAVRYGQDDDVDVHLFEVIENFPGDATDEIFETEFARSAELLILGSLHLRLASPAQLKAAVERNDAAIAQIKAGHVVYRAPAGERATLATELAGLLHFE